MVVCMGRTRLEPPNERKDEKIDMMVIKTTMDMFERFRHENCYSLKGVMPFTHCWSTTVMVKARKPMSWY